MGISLRLGIIDRLKIWIRSKLMEKKNYLVVVDTTDAPTRVTLPKGILNTYIIRATDPMAAKKILMGMFPRGLADQLRTALYVYELESLLQALANEDELGRLPLFSFNPLTGGRPARQTDVQLMSIGSQTLAPNTSAPATAPEPVLVSKPQQQVQQQPVMPKTVTRGSRTQEFQQGPENLPATSNRLTAEQADLVKRLGAVPTPAGSNEAVNPRINAATGVNSIPGNIAPDQAEILARLRVQLPQPEVDPALQREIAEVGGAALIDEDLTRIDGHVLGEDDLRKLENQ